jgi:hypothetical protein
LNYWHWKAHAHVVVQTHLNMMDAKGLDLHSSEKVDIRSASVDLAKSKVDTGLRDNLVLGVE